MADQRMQRDKIELAVDVRKLMGIPSLVGDGVVKPFLSSQPPGDVDQHRAVVNADDDDAGLHHPPEGAHLDAGAAAKGQDAARGLHRNVREVCLRQPRVSAVGPPKLQPVGDGRQHRVVHAGPRRKTSRSSREPEPCIAASNHL